MNVDWKSFSMDQLCRMIDVLDPSTNNYLFVYDYQKDYFYIAPHAVERFAIEDNAIHNAMEAMSSLVYPDDSELLREDFASLKCSERTSQDVTYRWVSKAGEPIWINSRGHVLRDEQQTALYLIGCINEVGETTQMADNISGLLSLSSLQALLDQHEAGFPEGYFLRVDVDDFKGINARLGMEYGDIVLRKMAEIISGLLSPGQEIFRLIGDEFMVVDLTGNGEAHARELYRRIQQAINAFIVENHYEVVFTVSAGFLACRDVDVPSYSKVMSLTEFALDEAKRHGKNLCYVYSEEDYQVFLKRKSLLLQLRQAVNNHFDGFEVYYQPLFNPFTHELAGAEALMRFRSEDYGMVSPAEFIPLLEESTLIIPAGRWILHESLRMCQRIKQVIPGFHISVNLSYVQVLRSPIEDEIIAAISTYGLSPSDVMIELTESGLLESSSRFAAFWKKLKAAGVAMALDDFGSGYSNFRYLAELGPDVVKIDRTFTAGAMRSSYEYELLSLFSKMVHQLNLKVCVEGVETENEFAKICQLPPEYIQGYFLGRPCPTEQFITQFVAHE